MCWLGLMPIERLPDLLTDALEHQRQGLAVDLSEYETYAQIVPDRVGGSQRVDCRHARMRQFLFVLCGAVYPRS